MLFSRRTRLDRSDSFGFKIGLAMALACAVAGCRQSTPQAARRGTIVPRVGVVEAERREVPIQVSGIGTTAALESVMIRARVSGFLNQGPPELFTEGSDVKKGQLLLVIDEAPFQAARDAAKANVDQGEAELKAARESKQVAIAQARLLVSQAQQFYAQTQERRAQGLLQRLAITREEYDEKKAAIMQADADVQAKAADLEQAKVSFDSNIALAQAKLEKARADLTNAALELGYCRMSAPIDGRIGELQVKLGNYVTGSTLSTQLVSIQQLDPMGIDIKISSRYLPEVQALVSRGLEVALIVQGDRPYPDKARVFFIDNTIDPNTSTFLVKARVPNPDSTLLPGDYVKTAAVIGTYENAVVVPEQAVIETQAGPVVYVVDSQNQVKLTRIQPVDVFDGLRVLESGLEPGQKVIVEGIQLARPGQTVVPETRPLAEFIRPPEEASPGPSGPARRLRSPAARGPRANGPPATPPEVRKAETEAGKPSANPPAPDPTATKSP